MEIKTCEQYVLGLLSDCQETIIHLSEENKMLKRQLEELKSNKNTSKNNLPTNQKRPSLYFSLVDSGDDIYR